MITVLPAPLGPTIRVKGLKKVMTFLFSGSKLRIPFINILSTVLIFFFFGFLSNSGFFFLAHWWWSKLTKAAKTKTREGFMQNEKKEFMILMGTFI